MIPPKLKAGAEVRVVSPSRSLAIIPQEVRDVALQRLKGLGLGVTISLHAEERDEFNSSPMESRLKDLHSAFSDRDVRAIFTAIGGYNANQLLRHLDYGVIRSNPKILCGYSDITALQGAIWSRTGLLTYSGPHFSTFGMVKGFDYTLDHFRMCLFQEGPFEVRPSDAWSDDLWFRDQGRRHFIKNPGYTRINEGESSGTIVGGNLCTLNLLQGTDFMPSLDDSILFLEDDERATPDLFDRDLQSLIHLPSFEGVQGLVFGRFQKASGISDGLLTRIIRRKTELNEIPVIAGVDFGHTTPHITFPIGGKGNLVAEGGTTRLEILEH